MSETSQPLALALVSGCSCDGCTLCCKVLNIGSRRKPRNVCCQHCDIGNACTIYEQRPGEGRAFYCTYRVSPELGEEWKHSVSKMVVNFESGIRRVNVPVDPDFPGAWQRDPYYGQLKAMALHLLRGQGHLLVWEADEPIAILPNRDVRLGPGLCFLLNNEANGSEKFIKMKKGWKKQCMRGSPSITVKKLEQISF